MTGLDTNVLVRHLTQDDPEQARRAGAVMAALTPEAPGYLNRIVLCELHWVLTRGYRYGRSEVAGAIEALLTSADLVVEDAGAAWEALAAARRGDDFADALLGLTNGAAGASATLTFDGAAARLPGFAAVP